MIGVTNNTDEKVVHLIVTTDPVKILTVYLDITAMHFVSFRSPRSTPEIYFSIRHVLPTRLFLMKQGPFSPDMSR
jgi:hypothetical protein